jgi:calcium-independent phospholipase A2-gamma
MKSSKLISNTLATYLRDTSGKISFKDMVNRIRQNPVSLSVNFKLQTQQQKPKSDETYQVVSTVEPLKDDLDFPSIVSQEMDVDDTPEPPLVPTTEQVNFEVAMNELLENNQHHSFSSQYRSHATTTNNHISSSSNSPAGEDNSSDLPATPVNVLYPPRMTRSIVYQRSKQLVKSLSASCSSRSSMRQVICMQELSKHIMLFPEAAAPTVKEGAIPLILRIRSQSNGDRVLASQSRQALTLLGYSDPPKGRGIKILSIDGGGIRGVVILEVLKRLESLTGQPVHKMFDLICGVSTGAILSMLLGALKKDLVTCDDLYRMVSKNLFVSDFWRGTSRLLWTHAYYDSAVWEKILKDVYSEDKTLIETSHQPDVPKVMAISASLNSPRIKPYVFRNFNFHPLDSHGVYEGSCKHKVWQSVRASTSAPGYFEDFVLDNHVHSDGGILINNPAAIAIHEAQCLWPEEKIQCIVSIGTGKYSPPVASHDTLSDPLSSSSSSQVTSSSLKAKITSLIDSATDTEITHRLLQDVLPEGSYFRMNPTLSEWMGLDENRPEKLDQLRLDAQMYVRKNDYKMIRAAQVLSQERSLAQISRDFVKLKYQQLFQ